MKAHVIEEESEGVMASGLSNGLHQGEGSAQPSAPGSSTAEKAGVILVSLPSHYP